MTLNKWSKYKSHWHHVSLKWCKEKGTSSPLSYSAQNPWPQANMKKKIRPTQREGGSMRFLIITHQKCQSHKKTRKNQETVIDWGTLRAMTTKWKVQSWTGSWNRKQVLVGKCLSFNYSTVSMLISEHGCLKYLLPLHFACECVSEWKCCREEANSDSMLEPFDLLFVAFAIIIIQKGQPQRILPLCLTVKLNCLCSEPCPL